ncbi:MAG: aldo/keto reductase [Sphingomonadales bacterium]|nr:aldo/keto reductase [Sphingomonadales bacterium]
MLPKLTLNATDLSVSQLCYGTNMLGTAIDQGRSNEILDAFVALGGNFIDTARMYGDWIPDAPSGASERAVGAWLKTRNRNDVVIATKGGGMDLRKGDWMPRVSPECIAQDLAESLDHLQIDAIDIYFLHADNEAVPVAPLIDALLSAQEAGTIRYFGASNWSAARIAEANAYAASLGKRGFTVSETFWGLAVPDVAASAQQGYVHYYEGEYEALHAAGLPILAYAAQSGGYFTKLEKGGVDALPDQLKTRYANPVNAARLAAARAVAGDHGVSINEVVLAYLVNQPLQTVPIFGGSSPEQVAESAKAAALKLSTEELARLRG